jgi:cation:H+ antiporter
MMYLMVAGGLAFLLLGGDVLVRGAVALAKRFDIPPLLIGLTVVAFGTSAPELVVSVEAALKGVPELAIGNVVGSNIANVLLVLGVPAMIYPIACDAPSIRRDCATMIGATAIFMGLCFTGLLQAWQGALMLAALIGYLGWTYYVARRTDKQTAEAILEEIEEIASRPQSPATAAVFVVVGLLGLVIGSNLLVNGAIDVARTLGLPEATIGLTMVALGTSMPELATSLVAALRRHADVAIGNVIGSNLFNILGIMGITAMVKPVPVPEAFLRFDLWVMVGAALLLAPFVLRGSAIRRVGGALLCLAYGAYVWSLFSGVSAMSDASAARITF